MLCSKRMVASKMNIERQKREEQTTALEVSYLHRNL